MTALIRHPYLDHPGPIAFAHRGGAADGLENTVAQFRRAVESGYRYIETDVHATLDGKLVAFHDATLNRMTDGTGRMADLPWKEIRRARVAGVEPVPSSRSSSKPSPRSAGTSTSRRSPRSTPSSI